MGYDIPADHHSSGPSEQTTARIISELKRDLRSEKLENHMLKDLIRTMEAERTQIMNAILLPCRPVYPRVDRYRKFDDPDQRVTTFRFPRPDPVAFCEELDMFIRKGDWEGREEWLKKMRWQIARRWARHAFNVFGEIAGGRVY